MTRHLADLVDALETEAADAGDSAPVVARALRKGNHGRSSRRAVLVASTVAAVIAFTIAVAAVDQRGQSSDSGRSRSGDVVPWNSHGQHTVHDALRVPLNGYHPRVSRCAATNLELVHSTSVRVNDHQASTAYELRYTGTDTCSWDGGVSLRDQRGHVVPLSREAGTATLLPSGGLPQALLDTGDVLTGSITWIAYAAAGESLPLPASVQFNGEPNVGPVIALPDLHIRPIVGARRDGRALTTGVTTRVGQLLAGAPGSISLLMPAVVIGPSAPTGTALQYTLRLTNTTSRPISFAPCPTLTQTLAIGTTRVVSSANGRSVVNGTRGPLNCSAARPVKPHRSIVFSLVLPTAGLPTGAGRLDVELTSHGSVAVRTSRLFTLTPRSGKGQQFHYSEPTPIGALIPVKDRKAPKDFSAQLLSGGGTSSTAAAQGKVLLVNFWASWCGPCTPETSALDILYRSIKGRGVDFLGIDAKDDRSDAQAFVKSNRLSYPIVYDRPGQSLRTLGNLPIDLPLTLLLDRRGRVAAVYIARLTTADLIDPINTLLSEK